jgi:hypothetical protein
MANEAVSHETRRVAFDKLTARPAPETPDQPAYAQIFFAFPSSRSPLLKAEAEDELCRANHVQVTAISGETNPFGIVRRAA